ncbi:MAG: CocE/NonD family hydrolase [Gammaproteobacteria bacterium]
MNLLAARILLLLAIVIAPSLALAQDFDFRPPASAADPALPAAMRDLAQRILPVYQENDQDRYLSNLSALQMIAGDPVSAYATRQSLQERQRGANTGRPPASRALVYDIYARARAIESQVRTPFGNAYAQAFRDALNRIDDLDAHVLEGSLTTPVQPLQEGLQRALDQRRGKTGIALNDALDLIWAWFAYEGYRSFSAVVRPLVAAEDKRRYVTEEDVTIPVSKTAIITATVVRPRIVSGKLPAILEFALDTETRDTREPAAHGYVSVFARVRGLRDKTDASQPFQTDGDDARAVIEWMAKQTWSNGRVGLLGTHYGGYVAWAAAKRVPPALKAIVTYDPMAPGVDLPMSGGIFLNHSYQWLYGVTAAPDDKLVTDDARWRALDEDWYKNGRRYREFPTLPGRASTIFRGWLNHPSYDRYWQKMLPFREEFARINIPVLTVTGYYSSGAAASLYYFTQHHQHNAHANHALLIGPYDDQSIERGPASSLRGLQLDSAAIVELHDAWYEWFDHALKGEKRPALLSANVNYQLTGANEWRHSATVDGPDRKPLRLYLIESSSLSSDLNRLSAERAEKLTFLPQTFDLQDRSDIGWRPARELLQRTLKARDGELFVSEPLKQAVDVAGLLHGQLDFTVNKVDMDLVVSLYELRPNGDYVKLFDPAYAFRASYARERVGDRAKRRLLRAGVRQQLSFQSERMMARRLQAGSRLIMALGINKRADQQLNYGTGDDVSEESIEDAGVPVRIRWYNSSFVEIPTQ